LPFPNTENPADAGFLIGNCRPQIAVPGRNANGENAAKAVIRNASHKRRALFARPSERSEQLYVFVRFH